jgi:hypothetical protein
MPARRRAKKTYGIYRSGLEKAFAEKVPKTFKYESESFPYVMTRKYLPDFVYEGKGKKYFIEAKGFFREGDTMKYKAIRDCLNDAELIFLLSDPNKKLRKGAKMTMGEWCNKEGFKHFTVDQTKELVQYVKTSYHS